MRVRTHTDWLGKAGNEPDEYEDAFWPEDHRVLDTSDFRCAVADGATETSFSGLWASMLVRAWCVGGLDNSQFGSTVAEMRRAWLDTVSKRSLPWYAEQKVRDGAFSSLLGLHVRQSRIGARTGSWTALAVGDSCLFHIRGNRFLRAFPLSRPDQFNNRPYLISSRANAPDCPNLHLVANGRWRRGDRFLLTSDALASWFLRERASGDRLRVPTGPLFENWMRDLRRQSRIRNDDVTATTLDLL